MSYNHRSQVNVVQYLRNLNNAQEQPQEEVVNDDELAKDLALFTNTHFFDFETGQNTDYQAPPSKPETVTQTSTIDDITPTDPVLTDFSTDLNFMSSEFISLPHFEFGF